MKLYLSGAWARQDILRGVRRRLQAIGHVVTSRWLDVVGSVEVSEMSRESGERAAVMDLQDVTAADHFIFDTFGERPARGSYVELGVALALQKPITHVGPIFSVFLYTPGVKHFDTWAEFDASWGLHL